MSTALGVWRRLPIVVRAVVTGLAVATAGTGPWAWLVSLNLRHGSTVPWAVAPTALGLWLFWRYVRGAGWPRSTADARRACSRVRALPDDVWSAALIAGVVGIASVLLFQNVLGRMVTLPQQRDLDPSKYPLPTIAAWAVMSALVAGITEEVAFRGYLQRPIERRHGPSVAILVTGVLFGLLHFTHPEVTLVLLPFYVGIAAVYGMLAYLTDSTLPGIVLHAGGNLLGAIGLFAGGHSEWGASRAGRELIWTAGADASFWLSLVLALGATAVAVWTYRELARVARAHRA
jgi:membrane protease YdiL (CAAX protease family)